MDHTDSEALSRRLANRDAHLAGLKKMVIEGTFISGGALLDRSGKMIGSSAHVVFDTREQLEEWLQEDPYTLAKVWDAITVQEVKRFPVSDVHVS